MDNIIEVEKKNQYGTDFYYPISEQAKKTCALLNGQKTLTPWNFRDLKKMGFVIRQVVVVNGKVIQAGEL